MNAITKIGKYLFAIPLIIAGVIYLVNAEMMTVTIPLAGSVVWVYVSGLVMLFAGVAIMIGKKDAVATFLLGCLFLIFAMLIHLPNIAESGFSNGIIATQFLKDLMIAGASFVYCRSAARDRSWRLL